MTTDAVLLDANVLIALSVVDHEHHAAGRQWLGPTRRFATTPITQGALVRYIVRVASVAHALDAVSALQANPRHEFWPDSLPYSADILSGVRGHRQVTDAYLVAVASARGSRLVTFDRGVAALRRDMVDFVESPAAF